MLKKLLIVSLIGLTSSFVYAEEKKVTGDMLVGKWECKGNEFSFKKYNSQGELTKSDSTIKSNHSIFFIYKKDGEKISEYPLKENENDSDFYEEMGIDRALDENQLSQVEYNVEFKGDQITMKIERDYISDNEFQMTIDSQAKDINRSFLRLVAHIKATCSRIK